jgi:hypothetical protein
VKLVRNAGPSTFGFDFPFGLPTSIAAKLLGTDCWEELIIRFSDSFTQAEEFRQKCFEAGDKHELKRTTDKDTCTPFSPCNLRLFRQTFYGIRDVLRPLVMDDSARVLPMQRAIQDKPWLVEICPASTLKKAGVYSHYKGSGENNVASRRKILRHIEASEQLSITSREVRDRVIMNSGGDALDSIIAALATSLAVAGDPESGATNHYGTEGRVFT